MRRKETPSVTPAKAGVQVFALVLLLLATPADARSRAEVRKFYRLEVCPATLREAPPCPGYVVDHVVPLCAGGADDPVNMQWQEAAEAKAKDRVERGICAWIRRSRTVTPDVTPAKAGVQE